MREIKFRAWVSNPEQEDHGYYTDEVLYDQGEWYIEGDGQWTHDELEKEGVYIEQFTGIQDSEGVDIYEGDVLVDLPFTERYGPSLCVWDGDRSGFAIQNQGESNMQYHVDFWKRARVVGNIHQHPHLFKE